MKAASLLMPLIVQLLTAQASANPEITVDLPGGATMDFVWIQPGTFVMGSPGTEQERYPNEGPQHEVTISQGFYLGKYEVTQGQWESVMTTAPWSGRSEVQISAINPAVYISWNDVSDFIQVLNEGAGTEIYRFPTEAEWEYACRAGTTTPWSSGDSKADLWDYAWFKDNSYDLGEQYGHQVGTKLPNPWGLYDMHGNVYEWCQDWLGDYSSGAQTDPNGPTVGSERVLRSGRVASLAQHARSARRGGYPPDTRYPYNGARLLRTGQ